MKSDENFVERKYIREITQVKVPWNHFNVKCKTNNPNHYLSPKSAQISKNLNSEPLKMAKIAVLTDLQALNNDFCDFFALCGDWNLSKYKNQSPKLLKIAFWNL